jgi:hypothetical protein
LANITDRKLLHIRASQRAAKAVRPEKLTVVIRGKRMFPREALQRGGFVIASWWDQNKTLICLRNGVLLLLSGEIAVEVTAHPDVLRTLFKPHYESKWWLACH